MNEHEQHDHGDAPCTESKLLALLTANLCLLRTLSISGQLPRELYLHELDAGRNWLAGQDTDHPHNVQAFDELLPLLKAI